MNFKVLFSFSEFVGMLNVNGYNSAKGVRIYFANIMEGYLELCECIIPLIGLEYILPIIWV